MANHISHASLPYPIKNARLTVLVPYLDADGDPTDPTTPDTEISQDGGAFADAAEEMTTITGSNGMGYITLSGAETNNSAVAVAAKVASGPKATLLTLYPRNLPILASGTASAGAAGSITLASSITYDITGCFVRTTGGTGGGGTGGANNQARRITAYNTSTQVATVTPNWETTPDATTTYDILCPEGVTPGMLKALNPTTAGRTADVDANGGVEVGSFQAGAITAAAIATGAIDADALAADVVAEIADGVWDEDATGHQTQGTFGQAIGDPGTDADTIWGLANTNLDATVSSRASAANLGTPSNLGSGATIAANLVDIEGQTDDIGAAGAGLTAVPWNAAWDAEVQSEVDDALVAQRLDEILNADSDIDGLAPPTVGSVVHELMSKTAGSFTYDQTTDSLEAIRDKETDIETDTQDIQTRLPAALVGARMDSSVGAVAANAIADAGVAADMDTYQGKVDVVRDSSTANRYVVIWFKNGQPITSGITSPTLQVIKAADGIDLVASTALTEIGSTHTFRHNETSNLMTAGAAYVAKIQATIDGSTRTWESVIGKDAS